MSWFRGLIRRLLGEDKKGERSQLAGLGVYTIVSERLAGRLEAIEKAYNDIFKEDKDPIERVHEMDKLIKAVAVAWARAGEKPAFSRMFTYWETLKRCFMEVYYILEETPEKQHPRILRILDRIAKRDVLPAGAMIIDCAWMDRDVAPHFVAVIQQTMGIGGAYPPPTRYDIGSIGPPTVIRRRPMEGGES